jgi:hypothetical protein
MIGSHLVKILKENKMSLDKQSGNPTSLDGADERIIQTLEDILNRNHEAYLGTTEDVYQVTRSEIIEFAKAQPSTPANPNAMQERDKLVDEPADLRKAVMDAISAESNGTYDCSRSPYAWSDGTMRESDFHSLQNNEYRLGEIADSVIAAIKAHRFAKKEIDTANSTETEIYTTYFRHDLPPLPPSSQFVHGYSQAKMWEYASEAIKGKYNFPYQIYLVDRADGCKGSYAIARMHQDGYQEVWNLRSHRWASASDDVLTLDQAKELLKNISVPTATRADMPASDAAIYLEALNSAKDALDTCKFISRGWGNPAIFEFDQDKVLSAQKNVNALLIEVSK